MSQAVQNRCKLCTMRSRPFYRVCSALSLYTAHILIEHASRPLSVTGIVDIMNLIGRCVVAGNVRQTAEIAFGRADLNEYLDLKNYGFNSLFMPVSWLMTQRCKSKAHGVWLDFEQLRLCQSWDELRRNSETHRFEWRTGFVLARKCPKIL